MKSVALVTSAVALFLAYATTAAAQSLGDIARQEEARRKAVKTSGKVYTNDTLRREPSPAVPSPPAGQTTQPAQPAPTPAAASAPVPGGPSPAAAPQPGGPAAAAAPPKDEAAWRKRIATARDALSRAQIFAEALQTRINALSTDFVNRDDPAQRNMIAADREKALAELARVQQEIQQHQKAIVAIQDEARRAGVPSGWVR